MFVGKLPVNVQAGAYTFVEKPDVGPDWQLRVQVQFLLPNAGWGQDDREEAERTTSRRRHDRRQDTNRTEGEPS